MFTPVPSELIDVLNEALAIAYQVCEDEGSAAIFREAMWVLEASEIGDGLCSKKLVSGELGEWKLH